MDLTPRKQAVLRAIVNAYIKTGEPVGSKSLTEALENAPSSATIRNEMSELCELGFLTQPHTSAGRVPTSQGFRFYVESLMTGSEPIPEIRQRIDKGLLSAHCEPEELPKVAAEILTSVTGLPVIACTVSDEVPRVKRIELLPIARFSVMTVVITDDGRTRSRIFRQRNGVPEAAKRTLEGILKNDIIGKRIDELTPGYIQNTAARAGLEALEIIPMLTEICTLAGEINLKGVTVQNEKMLYTFCGDERIADKLVSFLKNGDKIFPVLQKLGDGVGAIFGAETGYEELYRNTIIAAKFAGNEKYRGYIGVIGPERIPYQEIMPAVGYTAKKLTEAMLEAKNDLED